MFNIRGMSRLLANQGSPSIRGVQWTSDTAKPNRQHSCLSAYFITSSLKSWDGTETSTPSTKLYQSRILRTYHIFIHILQPNINQKNFTIYPYIYIFWHVIFLIGSMYGIYANIGDILMVNVTIYTSTMDPMGSDIPHIPIIFWNLQSIFFAVQVPMEILELGINSRSMPSDYNLLVPFTVREFSGMIHWLTLVISSSQQPHSQPIQQPYVKRTSKWKDLLNLFRSDLRHLKVADGSCWLSSSLHR